MGGGAVREQGVHDAPQTEIRGALQDGLAVPRVDFLHGRASGTRHTFVLGGDWNSDIREVHKLVAANPPEGCSQVSLHAPDSETCFGAPAPIDGILLLQ